MTLPQSALNVSIILYLTFPNPVWLENEKLGYSNETLRFYRRLMPRGFARPAIATPRQTGLAYRIDDREA